MNPPLPPADSDPRKARRAAGVYYTPEPVVQAIVRWSLEGWQHRRADGGVVRILEPACGEGVFLTEAFRYLLERKTRESDVAGLGYEDRRDLLLSSIFGVDIDPASVQTARHALATLAAGQDRSKVEQLSDALAANIRCGDALIDDLGPRENACQLKTFDWGAEFPQVCSGASPGFDAVIGNPPYVNTRLLLQSRGKAVKDYFRRRYRTARGSYDLYVLFIEKAFELLRPGGRCGFIVPNKIAGLDYAREVRRLLAEQCTIHRIVDLAGARVFSGASVYPYVIVWEKREAPSLHVVQVNRVESMDELESSIATTETPQCRLSAEAGWHLHGRLDLESRGPTTTLSKLASLHSGTTGFAASTMAEALVEHDGKIDGTDFIVSGNIDRYQIDLGDVRFMKRHFKRPVLPCNSSVVSDEKRVLFSRPKIVVAGMTKRLEAAWDERGLALGVQVYAASNLRIEPWCLLALLNSKLLSYLYWTRFQAKRLAGGYLSINKGQLGMLPIATPGPDDGQGRRHIEQLARLGRRRHLAAAGSADGPIEAIEAIDEAIDRLVYSTYRLTDREIQTVESRF